MFCGPNAHTLLLFLRTTMRHRKLRWGNGIRFFRVPDQQLLREMIPMQMSASASMTTAASVCWDSISILTKRVLASFVFTCLFQQNYSSRRPPCLRQSEAVIATLALICLVIHPDSDSLRRLHQVRRFKAMKS